MSNKRNIEKLRRLLDSADAVVIGAGAGLSAAAGFTYSGARFQAHFADFHAKYGFRDMYTGGFYPYATPQEYWAYWSRLILINRYEDTPYAVYDSLLALVHGKDYFVLTTNVDHCFQKAGFDKRRLFCVQGDYGLFQCSAPCHQATYANESIVRRMAAQQRDMRVPTALLPHCPKCGRPMAMNLRVDDRFVEDEGWHQAAQRYAQFLKACRTRHVLFLEIGVGYNTPGIIKFSFQRHTHQNPRAAYACLNMKDVDIPPEIAGRSLALVGDSAAVIAALLHQGEEKGHSNRGGHACL